MAQRQSSRLQKTREGAVVQSLVAQSLGLSDAHLFEVYTNMSTEDIRRRLQSSSWKDIDDHSLSVWDYVQKPTSRVSRAEAVEEVLASRSNVAECYGVEMGTLLVWAIKEKVWETHPDDNFRTADAWLESIKRRMTVERTIISGAQSLLDKETYLVDIAAAWGADWFEQIRADLKPEETAAWRLPVESLKHIASYASKIKASMFDVNRKLSATVEARHKRKRRNDYDTRLKAQDFVALANSVTTKRAYKKRRVNGMTQSARHESPTQAISETANEIDDQGVSSSDGEEMASEPSPVKVSAAVAKQAPARGQSGGGDTVVNVGAANEEERRVLVDSCIKEVERHLRELKALVPGTFKPSSCSGCSAALDKGVVPNCLQEYYNAVLTKSDTEQDDESTLNQDDAELGANDTTECTTQDMRAAGSNIYGIDHLVTENEEHELTRDPFADSEESLT